MRLRFLFFTIFFSAASEAVELPPEVEAERFLREAERLLQEKSYIKARKWVSKASSLPIKKPDKYYFILGTINAHSGSTDEALSNLALYMNMAGENGEYYQQALDTMVKIEGSPSSGFTLSSLRKLGKTQELSPVKTSSFVKQMTEKIVLPNQLEPLQHYLNSLLKANAVQNQISSDSSPELSPELSPQLFYRVNFNNEGRLIITRNEKDQFGMQSNIESLLVYGISSQLGYDCSWQEQRCWVTYPQNNEGKQGRWLEISYAPHAISELVDGMGLLIRELQK